MAVLSYSTVGERLAAPVLKLALNLRERVKIASGNRSEPTEAKRRLSLSPATNCVHEAIIQRQTAHFPPVIAFMVKNLALCRFSGSKVEILRHFVPQNDKKENLTFSND